MIVSHIKIVLLVQALLGLRDNARPLRVRPGRSGDTGFLKANQGASIA